MNPHWPPVTLPNVLVGQRGSCRLDDAWHHCHLCLCTCPYGARHSNSKIQNGEFFGVSILIRNRMPFEKCQWSRAALCLFNTAHFVLNSCWCFSIGFDGLLTRTRSAGEDETISNCDTFFVSYEYTAICVRFKHFWIPSPPIDPPFFLKQYA